MPAGNLGAGGHDSWQLGSARLRAFLKGVITLHSCAPACIVATLSVHRVIVRLFSFVSRAAVAAPRAAYYEFALCQGAPGCSQGGLGLVAASVHDTQCSCVVVGALCSVCIRVLDAARTQGGCVLGCLLCGSSQRARKRAQPCTHLCWGSFALGAAVIRGAAREQQTTRSHPSSFVAC